MREAGEFIKKNNFYIIEEWEAKVRRKIPASSQTASMVLRNILPDLLGDIGEILILDEAIEDNLDKNDYEEIINKSIDHGRHRATSSHYTVKQIIGEYTVLHQVITAELRKSDLYDSSIGTTLTYILEHSMSHSLSSFTQSIQAMREKLVGTLTHDLRNPISAAYLAIDMMNYKDGEETFNKLRNLSKKSLRRSIDLMEGMLDATRIKAGEGITLNFTRDNLINEIKQVIAEADEIYSNSIELDCTESEILAVYDGTAIRRSLENLITNAVKYGERDQVVTVSIENKVERVTLNVHNKGNPIQTQDKERIFEFLNRTDREDSGPLQSWGMGLAFVKMAAEAHGGFVEVVSNPDLGTTFSIDFHKFSNSPGKIKSKLNYSQSE